MRKVTDVIDGNAIETPTLDEFVTSRVIQDSEPERLVRMEGVSIRLHKSMLLDLDHFARQLDLNRSDLIRKLLEISIADLEDHEMLSSRLFETKTEEEEIEA